MPGKTKQKTNSRTADTRFLRWWVFGLVLLAGILTAGYLFWVQHSVTKPQGPDLSKLTGQWIRPDGGYILALTDPEPEGVLKAAYFNPTPIHVSRADWNFQDNVLKVFVVLQDVNYPGSTYTLSYNPVTDSLKGIYFQAATGQYFEVEFERRP